MTDAIETPETVLKISDTDLLDRIIDLGRQANSLEFITLTPPPGSVGLPASMPALLRRGADPGVASMQAVYETFRRAPERRAGTSVVTTLASFIDLTKRHADLNSAIFAKTGWPNPSLTTVIDYHQTDGTPRFGKHCVHYAFPITEEMGRWIGQNGKAMPQADFASFIEDQVADLASPEDTERALYERLFRTVMATPADMVQLSRGLQVKVSANVKNAIMLQTGEAQILFEEEHQNDKGERILVPGLFMISLAPFVDGEPVRIPARLRYRVSGGKISWTYYLYRWDVELRDRVKADLDLAVSSTELPAYEGAPEKP